MNITLQAAQPADLATLLPLVQAFHTHEQISLPPTQLKHALSQLLTNDTLGRIWLIQKTGETIGYIAICFGYSIEFLGRDGFIDEFFILPAYRGQGIGKFVLKRIQTEVQQLDIKALHLEVAKDNLRSQQLY